MNFNNFDPPKELIYVIIFADIGLLLVVGRVIFEVIRGY